MTGYNPIRNSANITAQGRGPAFMPVQSAAVTYPPRPTLNPQPGQGGGVGGSLGAPGMPGSAPDGMGGPPDAMGAFGLPGMSGTALANAPGQIPGGPQMGPASTQSLMDPMQEQGGMVPGAGMGSELGAGAFGPPGQMGGLRPSVPSPIGGASGFGNGMAGRSSRGAFGGGASGFGRR